MQPALRRSAEARSDRATPAAAVPILSASGGRFEFFFFQPRKNELIQRPANPIFALDLRQHLRLGRDERPMVFPLGALLDPASQQIDLRLRKCCRMIGHARIGIGRRHTCHQFRTIRISGNDRSSPRFARPQSFFTKEKGNAVLLAYAPMAGHAILIQDRSDVAAEVYLVAGSCKRRNAANSTPHASRTTTRDPANLRPEDMLITA